MKRKHFYNLLLVVKRRIRTCTNHKSQEILTYTTLTLFFSLFFNIAVLTKIIKTFHLYQSAIYCIHNSTPVNHIVYMPCTYPYQLVGEMAKEVWIYCACAFVLAARTLCKQEIPIMHVVEYNFCAWSSQKPPQQTLQYQMFFSIILVRKLRATVSFRELSYLGSLFFH